MEKLQSVPVPHGKVKGGGGRLRMPENKVWRLTPSNIFQKIGGRDALIRGMCAYLGEYGTLILYNYTPLCP